MGSVRRSFHMCTILILACACMFVFMQIRPVQRTGNVQSAEVKTVCKNCNSSATAAHDPAASSVRQSPGIDSDAPSSKQPRFYEATQGGYVAAATKYRATVDSNGGLTYAPQNLEHSGSIAELRVSLRNAECGSQKLDQAATVTARLDNETGGVSIGRSAGFNELFTPRGDGVEQSFTLQDAPPARGGESEDISFVCDLNLNGLHAVPSRTHRAGGIYFFDDTGKFRVRYGQVVVRDSAKHGMSIEPKLAENDRAVKFVIPGSWLKTATFPITVDPLIGGDFQISATNQNGVAAPAVCAGVNNFLVVWDDFTAGPNTPQLMASVLTSSGIASPSFALSDSSGAPRPYLLQRTEIAFDGANWLVVWSQDEAAGAQINGIIIASGAGTATTGAPVGTIIGGTNFIIATTTGTVEEDPLATYNGFDFVVAWETGVIVSGVASGSQIFYARVSSAGVVTPSLTVPAQTKTPNQFLLFMSPQTQNGDTLLLYRENAEVPALTRGARISGDGTLRDVGGISLFLESQTLGGFGLPIGVAFVNTGWQILSSYDQTTDSAVFMHQLSPSGIVTPPQGVFAVVGMGPTGTTADQFAPAFAGTVGITTNGNPTGEWLFLRSEKVNSKTFHILGKRIGFDGTDQDPIPFQIDTSTQGKLRNAVAAQAGNEFLVGWLDGRNAATQPGDAINVFGALVDATVADTSGPALVPVLAASPTSGLAPLNVSFDSGGSTGSLDTLLWTFGDGATSTFAAITHTYTQNGTYVAQLKLTKGSYSVFRTVVITVGNGGGINSGGGSQVGVPLQNSDGLVSNLLIQSATIALDFTQTNNDAATVGGIVDISSLPASLTGLTGSVSIGSVSHPFTLDAKGQFKSDASTSPVILFGLNAKKGVFGFTVIKDSLQAELAALGAQNVTTSPVIVQVPITVQLTTFSATSTVGVKYRATVNKTGTGAYTFLNGGATVSGAFIVSKFSAHEQQLGGGLGAAHTYAITGQIVRPNAGKYLPAATGNFLFEIGNYILSLPAGQFVRSGGNLKFTAHAGASGLKKFSINVLSGKFSLQLVKIAATGTGGSGLLLSSGNDITAVSLNLSFQFDLTDQSNFTAGRYIFIARKKPTSKAWGLQ